MRLHTEQTPFEWYCIDLDAYDGAPDSGPQMMGWGKTKEEAERDFMERLAEASE